MDWNTQMVRELLEVGKEFKMICGDVFGNVDPYIEWIKWLSYEPEFILEKVEEISNKKVAEITESERKLINKFKEDQEMARLFKIYGTNEINKAEYMKVYKYMNEKSIENLILRKLTKEELEYAKDQIKYYEGIPKEVLSQKVLFEQKEENYEKLSMVDSYILHMISKTKSVRDDMEFDRKLSATLEENYVMSVKSYIYAEKDLI